MDEPENNSVTVTAVDYATPATPMPSGESFGRRSARGGIIMTAMQIATAIVGFGTQIALSWFLLPSHFGILAVAVSIAAIVAVIRDAGAPAILIQRQKEFDDIAGSIFWLTLGSSIFCALFTATAAPIAAHVMQTPILLPVLLLTAARFPLGALGTVSNAKLMIDMRWGAVAGATLVQPLVSGLLSVLMAWRGWGVYALVIPPIIGDLVRALLLGWMGHVHASRRPRWDVISAVVGSSVFIVLTNLTIAVRSYGDYLTLSLTRDERETGLYYYAFMMSQALARLALASIPSVLGPAFSKLKEDEARHAAAVTSGIHMFAIIGVLPIVLQAALAWPLFRLFFHAKWAPAAPLFAILSLVILVSFLNNVTFQAMWAGGHYRRFFYYSAAFTPVFLVAFLIGALVAGGTGVAWAGVIVQAADFVFFSLMALPVLKVPVRPVFAPLWRPLVAAIPAAAVALMLHALLPPTKVADIACIIISGFLGTLAYVGILLMLWRQPVLNVWNHLLGAMNLSSR